MKKPVDPGYPQPDPQSPRIAIELEEARRHIDIRDWRFIPIRLADIIPRENIHWIGPAEFREWKAGLIAAYDRVPGEITPIVVIKLRGRPGKYAILDGHHRWRSARMSSRKALWVIEVRGRMREPLAMQKQRIEAG
jgi:hypothetical protein